jgi:hypothetical protein
MSGFPAFIAELRGDRRTAPHADALDRALRATDLEADGNSSAAAFMTAIEWIVAQPRSIDERLVALTRLASIKGKIRIRNMSEFVGWAT